MRFIIAIFAIFLFFSNIVQAKEINAGFVEGLWYSDEKIFVNQTTRIYIALRNNTDSDLTGVVYFKDDNETIATKNISAISGRLIEAWADWNPTYGAHTITATLNNVRLNKVGEQPEIVTVTNGVSENSIFVDNDTDNDGIGNEEDTDDDNDGTSDKEEVDVGRDPLIPDEPEVEKAVEEIETSEENSSSTSNISKEGLEQYFEGGTLDSLLSNITKKVVSSKKSLDNYRTKRSETNTENKQTKQINPYSQSSTTDEIVATITRYKIEPSNQGFFATLIAGISGVLSGLYTLLLWGVSNALSHPALIQIFLLIGILILVLKIARKWGRRPQ